MARKALFACSGIFAETLKAKYLDLQILAAIEKRN
jgi:hypothetical protein